MQDKRISLYFITYCVQIRLFCGNLKISAERLRSWSSFPLAQERDAENRKRANDDRSREHKRLEWKMKIVTGSS
jgi:hypothetical protein